MKSKRAVIAMSGGVDSTVAALLARQQGYEIIGVNLLMLPDSAPDAALAAAARQLQIEIVTRNSTAEFSKRILYPCAAAYAGGTTPNPCCECNVSLKFREIFAAADELNIHTVITGHYAKIAETGDGMRCLLPGLDRNKDQSYFLYRLTQSDLQRVEFPLGDLTKAEVRRIAAAAGLQCSERPDSQDACFQIPGECCGETLARLTSLRGKSGRFIFNGKTVGRHPGIHRYTIGQRQGLGVALGVPAYIKSIDPDSGDILLCTDQQELMTGSFTVSRCIWQSIPAPSETLECLVRIRYRSGGVKCRVEPLPGDPAGCRVVTAEPLRAVTPGQAAVFFADGQLLGGGIIDPLTNG